MSDLHEKAAVSITGIGVVTALGTDYASHARRLLAGESGIGTIRRFDPTGLFCQFAGALPDMPCPEGDDAAEFARRTRTDQALRWAMLHALRDAGLWDGRERRRIGAIAGIGGEWPCFWEAESDGPEATLYRADSAPPSAIEKACTEFGLSGPAATTGAACASSNFALALARQWLQLGWVDACVCGGIDLTVTPCGIATFCNLGALSKRNDAPKAASRPFDKNRDGFVMSEGAVFFVLERTADARRRGARLWAEIAGFGATSDAAHLVIPSNDREPAVRAIRAALRDARIQPSDVDYVNAHATSTPVGDKFETEALKTVFGEAIRTLPVSSTKGTSGHLLSAAAAFETLACVVAIQESAVPPTINLDEPDPECDLCHVPHQAQERSVRIAVNNSFGFGGSNTCIVLRKAA
jgi:3-oxoacyl-[acyl-carrier-protein] synthase II